MDQDGFVFRKSYFHHDIGPDSAGGFDNCCGFCEGETFWNWKQLAFWHRNVFCVSATDQQGAYLLAYLTVGIASVSDFASAFQAEDVRGTLGWWRSEEHTSELQ